MSAETLVFDLLAVDKASGVVRNVSAAFADADTKLQKASKVSGMALAAGGAAAVAFGSQAVMAASDLSETTSKIGVLFGDQSAAIQAWADTADTALGQSKQSALDAAATFATFGKAAGLQGRELTSFSTDLTGLASDLASFGNTSPEQAIEAIGAALRGESEPIRSYGVLLDEATLKAQAMSMGIVKASRDTDKIKAAQLSATSAQARYNEAVKKHGEDSREAQTAQAGLIRAQQALEKATEGTIEPLTNSQKVLAAQGAIMAQTKAAQGDFARTSSGAANQQRILAAEVANLSATAGTALLPAFQAVVSALVAGVTVVGEHQRLFAVLGGTLAVVAATIWTVNAAQTAWAVGSKIVTAATKAWTAAQWLINVALTANPIGLVIVGIAALVAAIVIAYKKSETFRSIVQATGRGVVAAFNWILAAGKAVFGWVSSNWGTISKLIAGPIGAAAKYVVQHWDEIRQGTADKVGAMIAFVRGIPGKVKGAIGNLGDLLKHAGSELIQGLIDGITSRVRDVTGAVSGLASKIKGFFPGSPVKTGPLTSWNGGGAGRRLVGMLADGMADTRPIDDSASRVASAISGLTADVPRIRGLGAAGARTAATSQTTIHVTVHALNPTPAVGRLVMEGIEQHLTRGGAVSPRLRTAVRAHS